MGDRSNDTIWHDEVEIGKTRKIAARGLTINHLWQPITVRDVPGELVSFQHFDTTTRIAISAPTERLARSYWASLDVPHLEEVEVTV